MWLCLKKHVRIRDSLGPTYGWAKLVEEREFI